VNLIVIDATPDPTALDWDRKCHPDAIEARSVTDMVHGILGRLGSGGTIDRLIIWAHGEGGSQYMGLGPWDRPVSHPILRMLALGPDGQLLNQAALGALTGRFSAGGIAELHGCRVAQHRAGRRLLEHLANLWQVAVRAGLWDQPSDLLNRFWGPVFEATPGQPAHQI
jgi:hypothetical protein